MSYSNYNNNNNTQNKDSVVGKFTRCIYKNPEGFIIGAFTTDTGKEIVAKGTIIPFNLKQEMELEGVWEKHSKFGKQLKVTSYKIPEPKDADAILAYLSSGIVKGVGKATAQKIIKHFGEDSLEIINNEPHRLIEVNSIGKKTVQRITEGIRNHKEEQDIMLFLMKHGITALKASRIYKHFKKNTIKRIEENPYSLTEIRGIGFPVADSIAFSLGWEKDCKKRIGAGILYFLKKNCYENGHAFLTKKQVIDLCTFNLEVSDEKIEEGLAHLVIQDNIVLDNNNVYLRTLYDTEVAIAEAVCQEKFDMYNYDNFYATILSREKNSDIKLAPKQRNAIWMALNSKMSIITGGPGVGKTLTIKFLLQMLEDYGKKPICAAPTGRAAKRISEMSGFPAYTIHRLLGLRISEKDDEDEDSVIVDAFPIGEYKRANVLIIDEASMIDMPLMKSILDNLGERQLLLVGDVDQLPSVGPGKIFKDIIESGAADVVVLDEVFRQAQESAIIQNARKINKGVVPDFTGGKGFEFKEIKSESKVVDDIVSFLQYDALAMEYDPLKDVQVLTPMKKGVCGVNTLNQTIQERLNPCMDNSEQLFLKNGVKFRLGDKVMQVVNNYDKGVYNGEWGFIIDLDFSSKTILIDFQDKVIDYEFSEINELVHAYAITVHKCLDGSTELQTNQGTITLEELWNISKDDGREKLRKVKGFSIQSQNSVNDITEVFKGDYELGYKITTRRGIELLVSKKHPISVGKDNNGEIIWKKSSELKENDNVILNVGSGIFSHNVNEITPNEAAIIGTLFAMDSKEFINSSYLSYVSFLLKKEYRIDLEFKSAEFGSLYRKNTILDLITTELYYRGLSNISFDSVPEYILKGNYDVQKSFLAGICKARSYSKAKTRISFNSQAVTKSIQNMFFNFGVLSSVWRHNMFNDSKYSLFFDTSFKSTFEYLDKLRIENIVKNEIIDSISSIDRIMINSYDIEVEKEHNFLTNTILSKNSQGSEFKCVITPVVNSQRIMLQRNLLYTGVTRASEMLYLIGHKEAVELAVKNNQPIFRNTYLKERIIASKAAIDKKK